MQVKGGSWTEWETGYWINAVDILTLSLVRFSTYRKLLSCPKIIVRCFCNQAPVAVFVYFACILFFMLLCSFLSQFIGSLMGGPVHHGPVNIQLYVYVYYIHPLCHRCLPVGL